MIGFLIGIIPGSAHMISTFVSYAVERRVSKHPEEFGRGAVAGVAGPESANNARDVGRLRADAGAGRARRADRRAAAGRHDGAWHYAGAAADPQDPQLFWGFIASMYVGNVILFILNLPLVGLFVNLLRVPYPVMYPLILVCSILGVYAGQQQRGRRVDHARHGRRSVTCCASSTSRRRPSCWGWSSRR